MNLEMVFVAAFSTLCSYALPQISQTVVTYDERYYKNSIKANAAIAKRDYMKVERLLREVGYVDGKSEAAYGSSLNYLEIGSARNAILALYQSEFCSDSLTIERSLVIPDL